MRFRAILFSFVLATSAFAGTSIINPTTTNNDDSCDIAVQPAATLLLPFFEVDFKSPQNSAKTTLFTIQNVSHRPQIAHVKLWTDWGYPALNFPIFLTGYDVQGINLYDIFARAIIAPGSSPGNSGTSSNTPVPTNPTSGSQTAGNGGKTNFLAPAPKKTRRGAGRWSTSGPAPRAVRPAPRWRRTCRTRSTTATPSTSHRIARWTAASRCPRCSRRATSTAARAASTRS